jgi:hypothetical protein
MLLVLSLAIALMATVQSASPVRAEGPLRSGTIVSGTGESPANFWVRGMEGCVGAPACSAWLQSACHPALAAQDPAVHASIVDVADLADDVTQRVLDVRDGIGINWGHFIVQFWTGTVLARWHYCGEIVDRRLTSWQCGGALCTFRIPSDARWMTITSSPDNTNIRWTLS